VRLQKSVVSTTFFFFQAEDGIRDGHVTGVQTCALPIYLRLEHVRERLQDLEPAFAFGAGHGEKGPTGADSKPSPSGTPSGGVLRSEERRVGKEGRCRCGRDC